MVYRIQFNSGVDTVKSLQQAKEVIRAIYGPEVVFADSWDDAGEGKSRLLAWENEADAEGDAGESAIAQIIRNRPAG